MKPAAHDPDVKAIVSVSFLVNFIFPSTSMSFLKVSSFLCSQDLCDWAADKLSALPATLACAKKRGVLTYQGIMLMRGLENVLPSMR